MNSELLLAKEWEVRKCPLAHAQDFIAKHHYAKGGSNTAVYTFGAYRIGDNTLRAVAWFLPPTKVACESVNKAEWKRVLGLTRMAVLPGEPKNVCSYLLGKCVRIIRADGRFVSLVTYADESQGHTGHVYKACGWDYIGRTGPYTRWVDKNGRQVSQKSTNNRVTSVMLELGHTKVGAFYKHKYVKHLQ